MPLFSQHDPAFDRLTLGRSSITVHGFGCYVTSIATLFQKSVPELLQVPGGITADGLAVSDVLAKYCGGSYGGVSSIPSPGWCIGVTNKYANLGYPRHFICVNVDAKLQIDPLKFPAVVEPLTYPIIEYRVFGNTKLGAFLNPPTSIPQLKQQLTIAEEAVANPVVLPWHKKVLTRLIIHLEKLLEAA